jgi:hypothetical protein
LLRYVQNLRLSGSGSVLKSLSHTTLRLQQLDLCSLTIAQTTLVQFLQQNANSISSIEFHNVKMVCTDSNDLVALSPELCRSRLSPNMLFLSWEASPCPICGHSGWRMSKTWCYTEKHFTASMSNSSFLKQIVVRNISISSDQWLSSQCLMLALGLWSRARSQLQVPHRATRLSTKCVDFIWNSSGRQVGGRLFPVLLAFLIA